MFIGFLIGVRGLRVLEWLVVVGSGGCAGGVSAVGVKGCGSRDVHRSCAD